MRRGFVQRFEQLIDTHTADGLKVAREHVEQHVPMIVLETALPVKFADAITEALGRGPEIPEAVRGLDELPRRVHVMAADTDAVKAYIEAHSD